MSFFRIKKINGNDYLYLVENKWTNKGSRQKVSKYLGKVYRPSGNKAIDFFEFSGKPIEEMSKEELTLKLIKWELAKKEFREIRQNVMFNGCFIDLNKNIIYDAKNKAVALAANEGFLIKDTLNNLVNFKADGSDEEIGYKLAKVFVDCGIAVPKDVFVLLFEKIQKSL